MAVKLRKLDRQHGAGPQLGEGWPIDDTEVTVTLPTGWDQELEPERIEATLSMVRTGIEALLEKRFYGPFGARDQADYEHLTSMELSLLLRIPNPSR